VKPADAKIHHYGWVKPPFVQQLKQRHFNKLWHSDEQVNRMVSKEEWYDYLKNIDSLVPFEDTHPSVMRERVAAQDWAFEYDYSLNHLRTKDRLKQLAEKLTGRRWGEYRNYRLL
jgi:hypothetical protein